MCPVLVQQLKEKVITMMMKILRIGKYSYRLKQIDHDGTSEYSNAIEVDVIAPGGFSLEPKLSQPI